MIHASVLSSLIEVDNTTLILPSNLWTSEPLNLVSETLNPGTPCALTKFSAIFFKFGPNFSWSLASLHSKPRGQNQYYDPSNQPNELSQRTESTEPWKILWKDDRSKEFRRYLSWHFCSAAFAFPWRQDQNYLCWNESDWKCSDLVPKCPNRTREYPEPRII